jgi:predicted RNase H-like HicB family nuclease
MLDLIIPKRSVSRRIVASQGCDKISLAMKLTAVFMKVPEGYVAFIEELPGPNTQGVTLDEARENLHEAVALVLDANRALTAPSESRRSC